MTGALAILGRIPGLSLAGSIPPAVARAAGAVLDLVGGADMIGPPAVPPAFARLIEEAAGAVDLPPELLAAVAAVRSGWRPDAPGGLVGLPPAEAVELRATVAELVAGDRDAADRVRRNVEAGAGRLAWLRTGRYGLAGALLAYVAESAPESQPEELRAMVAEIVGCFVIYLARQAPDGGADRARAMLGALAGG